jgi:hypothetical protein
MSTFGATCLLLIFHKSFRLLFIDASKLSDTAFYISLKYTLAFEYVESEAKYGYFVGLFPIA